MEIIVFEQSGDSYTTYMILKSPRQRRLKGFFIQRDLFQLQSRTSDPPTETCKETSLSPIFSFWKEMQLIYFGR